MKCCIGYGIKKEGVLANGLGMVDSIPIRN
jgi:hypothetical protein